MLRALDGAGRRGDRRRAGLCSAGRFRSSRRSSRELQRASGRDRVSEAGSVRRRAETVRGPRRDRDRDRRRRR